MATTRKKPTPAKKAPPKKAPAKKRGRPTTYTAALGQKICERLSKGTPLAEICRDKAMPAVRTVSDWKAAHEAFAAAFARAREDGFDAIATDCLRIADDTTQDTIWVGRGDNTHEAANSEWISRSKLRVETRLKLLAKWDPKRYGEKIAVGGAEDLPPIKNGLDVSALPTAVLAEIMRARDAAVGS